MSKKIQKWRQGAGGLVAAIIWRARLDWKGTSHIKPDEAKRLAYGHTGHTLPLETCRFAVGQGFDCPSDEIRAFLNSDWLLDLMSLVGVESLGERIKNIIGAG